MWRLVDDVVRLPDGQRERSDYWIARADGLLGLGVFEGGFVEAGGEAVGEVDRAARFVVVDADDQFGIGRRHGNGRVEKHRVWADLTHWKRSAVDS